MRVLHDLFEAEIQLAYACGEDATDGIDIVELDVVEGTPTMFVYLRDGEEGQKTKEALEGQMEWNGHRIKIETVPSARLM